MERLRKLSAGSYRLTVKPIDEDGADVTPTGTLGLTIKDGAGAAITHGATPTFDSGSGELVASVAFGALPELDTYVCRWTATEGEWISHVELVGGFLFEIPELRAVDPTFADASLYPAERIRSARTRAEMRIEQAAHVAYVPRGRRVRIVAGAGARLRLPDNAIRRLVSCKVAGRVLTGTELAMLVPLEWGAIDADDPAPWISGDVVEIHYEHGEDFPPEPISGATMLVSREYLIPGQISSRATVEATDVGFFRLSVAGRDKPIGIPEVDAVIDQFGRRRPFIA